MSIHVGAAAITKALNDRGLPLDERQVREQMRLGRLEHGRVGRLLAASDEQLDRSIQRWLSQTGYANAA